MLPRRVSESCLTILHYIPILLIYDKRTISPRPQNSARLRVFHLLGQAGVRIFRNPSNLYFNILHYPP